MNIIKSKNIHTFSFNVTRQELRINPSYSLEYIENLLIEIELRGLGEKERGTTYKQYIER